MAIMINLDSLVPFNYAQLPSLSFARDLYNRYTVSHDMLGHSDVSHKAATLPTHITLDLIQSL